MKVSSRTDRAVCAPDQSRGIRGGSWVASVVALLSIIAGVMIAQPTVASAGAGASFLLGGESLTNGSQLRSTNSAFILGVQGDGNVVEYANIGALRALWATGTNEPGTDLEMQTDGNLVAYGPGHVARWASNTSGHLGAYLAVQDDGNLVIIYNGVAVWQNGAVNTTLIPGQRLTSGQYIQSPDRAYRLLVQSDGNIVTYHGNVATWSTATASASTLEMQTDGNLVGYSAGHAVAVWAAGVTGNNVVLELQNDGNAVLYATNHVAIWSSANSGGRGIVGNIFDDSTGVPCASGTRDVGLASGYRGGTVVRIRLCALPNLTSSSEESAPGSSFYVANANRNALVNSRVSGPVFDLVASAKKAGITLAATSSFRTMAHQQALCSADANCRNGNYAFVAKPGTSNHQMGLAIDFSGTNVKGSSNCAGRAKDPASATWSWLSSNAAKYGYRQYAAESWHWDPTTGTTMC